MWGCVPEHPCLHLPPQLQRTCSIQLFRVYAGAFEIAEEQGTQGAFASSLVTFSLIHSKCVALGGAAPLAITQGGRQASQRLAEAFVAAVKQARVASRASVVATTVTNIERSVDDQVANAIEWVYAWDAADHPAVAAAIDRAFAEVCHMLLW
jgi:hypothetical protein